MDRAGDHSSSDQGTVRKCWWRFEWAVNMTAQAEPQSTYSVRRLVDHRQYQEKHGEISLEEALFRYEDGASTDFRDRIFGVLGIVQAQGFSVDSSVSSKELFVQTIDFCESSNPVRLGAMLGKDLTINPTIYNLLHPHQARLRRLAYLNTCCPQRWRSTESLRSACMTTGWIH